MCFLCLRTRVDILFFMVLSILQLQKTTYPSLISVNTTSPMVCIASRDYTIHSYPLTQQITNLMKCGVVTCVNPTCNTTNTTNIPTSYPFGHRKSNPPLFTSNICQYHGHYAVRHQVCTFYN